MSVQTISLRLERFQLQQERAKAAVRSFPTPAERYDKYRCWCAMLGVQCLPFTGWLREVQRVPDRMPIAWNQ